LFKGFSWNKTVRGKLIKLKNYGGWNAGENAYFTCIVSPYHFSKGITWLASYDDTIIQLHNNNNSGTSNQVERV